MSITIITSENRRLYPAIVYSVKDREQKNPIFDIDDIYDLLYNNQKILVISAQFDQYGKERKVFNGELGKSDIKAMFLCEDIEVKNELDGVMTLSEAAKKWGLADGSTIRKAIERKKFKQDEIKQAGNVWLTTYSAMERVFGPIKNEERSYVIYDDFEYVYVSKAYWKYSDLYYEKGMYVAAQQKEVEIKYAYIKDICIEALKSLDNNQKVIIKKSNDKQIKQIIESKQEFYSYVELFFSRKIFALEVNQRLISELKNI